MGLFSKKRKVNVGVSAVRMADKIDNPYKQAVLTSVLGNVSMSDTVKSEALHGFYAKSEAYYRYGKNKYINGLPEGFKTYTDIDKSKITTALNKIFAQPVKVETASVSFADYVFFVYVDLQVNLLYTPATGLINKPPVIYPPGTKVKVLGINIQDKSYSVDVEINKVPLNESSPTPPKEYTTYSRTYTYDETKLFLHVKYQLPSDVVAGTFRYWFYDVLNKTYPEIDTILDESWGSPFYPLVPVRENKVNTIDTPNSKNISRMLDKLGVKLESVTEAIMSRKDGNNPDLLDEAFIGFFANLHEPHESTRLYLFEFFLELYNRRNITKNKFDSWEANKQGVDTPQEAITIKEKDFNIRLLWNYINLETKTGSIGQVKTVTINTEINPRYTLSGLDYEKSRLIIRKQITTNTYQELVIHGLEHITDVYEGTLYSTTLADLSNEDKKTGFFIPLDRNIVKRIPFNMRSQLMMDCLTIVVYAVQVSYVKWYQRGLFKVLITVIILVVSFYFGDWSGTFAQGFWAAATAIATDIIINMILVKGLEIVMGMVGGELAAIIAAAVAVYAIYNPNNIFNLKTPNELLKAATLTVEATNNVIADDFRKLLASSDDLMKTIKEKKEEIQKVYDMLDNKNTIDFFDIRKGGFYFNPDETPSQFFERTIGVKNPGTMAYDELEYFYENALKLKVRPQWEF